MCRGSRDFKLKILLIFTLTFASLPSHAFRSTVAFWKGVAASASLMLFAGNMEGAGNFDGTGNAARFSSPGGVAVDSAGNVYIADTNNFSIRKMSSAGVVTTLAGSGMRGVADGTGTAASFTNPVGIAVDASGNVYVTEQSVHIIRRITPAGVVTTLAGQAGVAGSANGSALSSTFNSPYGIAVNSTGEVFVADSFNQVIRKISAGVVTTFAGSVNNIGSANGVGGAAQFYNPAGIAVDSADNLYVADSSNHVIRRITPAGSVSTFSGLSGGGYANGASTVSRYYNPKHVAVDSSGNVYVTEDQHQLIRKITPAQVSSDFAGTQYAGGTTDATGAAARFFAPLGVAVNGTGPIYVTDSGNHTVRRITTARVVTTLAGSLAQSGATNNTGALARFSNPSGIVADASGNIFVADFFNLQIRRITPAGVTTTFAGNGTVGTDDGTGGAARFLYPTGIAKDSSGNLYVTDSGNHTIRKITPGGVVTTLAGHPGIALPAPIYHSSAATAVNSLGEVYVASGQLVLKLSTTGVPSVFAGSNQGNLDGTGAAAEFGEISGITVDSAGTVYVSDVLNHNIRVITPAGDVTTLAGAGSDGFLNDTGAAAYFDTPTGLAVDSFGDVFVADQRNNQIRRVTPAGVVTTFAGATTAGSANGTGTAARFDSPLSITIDSADNLYVGDLDNGTIRKITPGGVVTTLAGTAGALYVPRHSVNRLTFDSLGNLFASTNGRTIIKITSAGAISQFAGFTLQAGFTNGTGTGARFTNPAGLTVDAGDNIYVADTDGYSIRRITPAGVVSTYAGSTSGAPGSTNATGNSARFNLPSDVVADGAGNIYVADTFNNMIRRITTGRVVSTFAGNLTAGSTNATGTAASFNRPRGLAIDSSGNIYVADTDNHLIRKITTGGAVTTLAGSGAAADADGTGTAASFDSPASLSVDASGNVFVTGLYSSRIRQITPAGVVTTFAGSSSIGSVDGTGSGAQFGAGLAITKNSVGDLFVSDQQFQNIRKVTSAAVVTTFSDLRSSDPNGTGSAASFTVPAGLAADASANIYVSDSEANMIRKITPAGVVTTLAGSPTGGYVDATGASARFAGNFGLSIDAAGDLFVSDPGNYVIRRVTSAGVVTTFSDMQEHTEADGTGAAAYFSSPAGIAVDSADNIYVADTGSHRIRKVTPAGVVTTLAGQPSPGSANGTGATARFLNPNAIAIDTADNIYVADGNYLLRKITTAGVVTSLAGQSGVFGYDDGVGASAKFQTVSALLTDPSGNILAASGNTVRKITPAGLVTTVVGSGGSRGFRAGTLPASLPPVDGLTIHGGRLYISGRHGIMSCPAP